MLFSALEQMQSSPFRGLVTLFSFLVALVVALTVHEFSHALSSTLLGDNTARTRGRLSLHPLAHLDPLGTAMIVFAGFGWGRPVPVNPAYLRAGARTGMAVVSLAGPLSNVMVAAVAAVPINAGYIDMRSAGFTMFPGQAGDVAGFVISSLVFWNLLLAALNLLPVSPLDGFKVALGVLPRQTAFQFAQLERYGPAILLSLIMLDYLVPGTGIISGIIQPITNALGVVLLGEPIW